MMTHSWMEALSPTAAYCLLDQRKSGNWTQLQNKLFEDALAYFDEGTPGRWAKVAERIPGKTVGDVMSHYQDLVEDVNHIEAGLIPFPGYSSSFMLDWDNCAGEKRSGSRPSDHERKKGVPWTEDEHRLFLLGLKKYGKGDWRNISRNFVVSRTPTQVASHAQKYFIRLNSGSKDKRRSSIHDITTVNLPDNRPLSPPQPSGLSMQSTPAVAPGTSEQFSVGVDSNQHNEVASVFSSSAHGNQFMQPPYGIDTYGMKSQAQHLYRGDLYNSIVGYHSMLFQMQTVQPHPHG